MIKFSNFTNIQRLALPLSVAWVGLVANVQAHPGHYHPPDEVDEFDSFAAGFFHPFTGLDHALLAIAMGWLLITRLDRSAASNVVCFLMALLGGALIGRFYGATPGMEVTLAGTVLCSGIFLLLRKQPGMRVLLCVASISGLIHGLAHGSESLALAGFTTLLFGLTLGTTILMAVGCLLGRASSSAHNSLPPRMAGAALFAFGAVFLWNAI